MKIRTQNALTIVPIFVGMGVILGFLKYTTERQELLWGAQEEVSSLAVSIAEFLTDADVQKISKGEELESITKLKKWNALKNNPQNKPLEGIAEKYYKINNLYFLIPKKKGKPELKNIINKKKSVDTVPQNFLEFLSGKKKKTAVQGTFHAVEFSEIQYDPQGSAYLSALVPLSFSTDSSQKVFLGVDTDISYYDRHLNVLQKNITYFTAGTGFLGLLIALFLSRLLTEKIKTLNKAAKKVIVGTYDQPVEIGTIQEVSELSNTFNTMNSILQEVLSKRQKDLIIAEQFLTDKDLEFKFQELNLKPRMLSLGPLELGIQFFGDRPKGDFLGIFETKQAIYAVMGRIAHTEEANLQRSLDAFSVYAVFKSLLSASEDPEDAVTKAGKLFDIEVLHCLCFAKEGNQEKTVHVEMKGEKVTKENCSLSANSTLVFHTSVQPVDTNISLFAEAFSKLPVSDIMSQLERNWDRNGNEVCLALLKRKASGR